MFISFGQRRINLELVKEYKSIDKEKSNTKYIIEFVFLTGEKEELNFFNNKEERDNMIQNIDSKLLWIF